MTHKLNIYVSVGAIGEGGREGREGKGGEGREGRKEGRQVRARHQCIPAQVSVIDEQGDKKREKRRQVRYDLKGIKMLRDKRWKR